MNISNVAKLAYYLKDIHQTKHVRFMNVGRVNDNRTGSDPLKISPYEVRKQKDDITVSTTAFLTLLPGCAPYENETWDGFENRILDFTPDEKTWVLKNLSLNVSFTIKALAWLALGNPIATKTLTLSEQFSKFEPNWDTIKSLIE